MARESVGGPHDDPRESRSAYLRRQNRRIFLWSLGLAVFAHAVVLFFMPWYRASPFLGGSTRLVGEETPSLGGISVDVTFGPPSIVTDDGSLADEPGGRELSASRSLPPPYGCASQDWLAIEGAVGEVRMVVGDAGRPDTIQVTRTTGDRCWDAVMAGLSSDLWYRWLPNDRFKAPVELFQPVRMSLTGY